MTNAPPLRDDCFVMPRGVKWTPVEEALEKLHKSLKNITKTSVIPVSKCCGRILAEDVVAQTNHPPFSNSAVDGYGFALSALPDKGEIALKLTTGRSAAGNFYFDKVPAGYGLRILTGAQIPDGVDTVILEEDVNKIKDIIYFNSGLKKGANIRAKGEDILSGSTILQKVKN